MGAPRLNNQSDGVSILEVRTSKDRYLDRSAKLWIIAEPDPKFGVSIYIYTPRRGYTFIFRSTLEIESPLIKRCSAARLSYNISPPVFEPQHLQLSESSQTSFMTTCIPHS
jgi:hypothetical protein